MISNCQKGRLLNKEIGVKMQTLPIQYCKVKIEIRLYTLDRPTLIN